MLGEKMDKEIYAIAIDGPAGSGKSTIAKKLASKLGILFLSTGSLYRAMGLKCKNLGLDPKDELSAQKILDCKVDVKYINGSQNVFLDGENVTNQINNEEIGAYASLISQHKCIREKCVEIQRQIASSQSMIVDGRDIGSVVLPMAKYKFYLDADVHERAKRRYKDLTQKGINTTLDEVEAELKQRDYNDIHRKLSPLVLCNDAIRVDSTNLSIDQVVDEFMKIINKK